MTRGHQHGATGARAAGHGAPPADDRHPDDRSRSAPPEPADWPAEAEWHLVAERRRLTAVLATVRAGAILEDEGQTVLAVNDELLGLIGHPGTTGDLTGIPRAELVARISGAFADAAGFRERVAAIAETGARLTGEELEQASGAVLALDYLPIHGAGALWQLREVGDDSPVRLGSKFVATVAHELRTPLTSVVSFAHMLADPANGDLTAAQQKAVEVIERNAGRLLRLIEDLLLVVKLESRSLPLQPTAVELAELVRTCVADRAPAAEAVGVALRCTATAGPALHGDPVRIQQVLDNLIGNALKFTPAGGEVAVSATPADHGWWLVVRDTGVGVPADELDRLFTTFSRGSNAVRLGVPGTGLGLVIVRAIVDLHGGQIDLTSNEGGGTSVSVWLPHRAATDEGGAR